jgi:glycosyltransferase involved in cell wall biosynthesis
MQVLLVGPHDVAQEEDVRRAGLSDVVRFEDSRPHREILEMEAGADALLLIKHRSPGFRDLIPGKLYEYMGAGRPVIAVVPESPAAELVRGLGLGWTAPPGDAERIAAALEEALSGRAPARHTPGDRTAFTRKAQAAHLARILAEIA